MKKEEKIQLYLNLAVNYHQVENINIKDLFDMIDPYKKKEMRK